MLKKFNEKLNVIYEDIAADYFEQINPADILFENMTIAIVPGSFKPPHKGHWEMIMKYVNNPDINKVLVLISNISTKTISNRFLSLTNLKQLGKIKEYINKNNLNTTTIDNALNTLDTNIETLTFNTLKDTLNNEIIPVCDEINTTEYIKLKDMINKYILTLENNLFKSIRKAGKIEITPEISKEIFETFANNDNVLNKVEIKISESASPIVDTIRIINYNCKNCTVILGVSNKGKDAERWKDINKSIKNPTVNVISMPIEVDTKLNATDIRNNITDLKKEYFPDVLSETAFKQIKNILQ